MSEQRQRHGFSGAENDCQGEVRARYKSCSWPLLCWSPSWTFSLSFLRSDNGDEYMLKQNRALFLVTLRMHSQVKVKLTNNFSVLATSVLEAYLVVVHFVTVHCRE